MNSPPSSPTHASAPWHDDPVLVERTPSRLARRLAEHAVVALLLAMVAVLVVAAWPITSRLIKGDRALSARRGAARALRLRGWAAGPRAASAHSRYAPKPRALDRALLDRLFPDPHQPVANAEGRGAFARGQLELLDRADHEADPVTTLQSGTPAVVVKDTGVWLLLALQKNGRTMLGWTTRDQVVILP